MINTSKIALIYNDESPKLYEPISKLKQLYNFVRPEEAELIVVLGGDGQLLHALHKYMHLGIPYYGINFGAVGFLMNSPEIDRLVDHLSDSVETTLYPLSMEAEATDGRIYHAIAINEVSIFRKTNQAAKFMIEINNTRRIDELVADGALVATAAGSSAYNFSAGGPILPIGADMLCLTPICPFRPRRWQGALLPSSAVVKLTMIENDKRPVNAVADFQEFPNIKSVTIKSVRDKKIKLLFDRNHSLEDRILKEQFLVTSN